VELFITNNLILLACCVLAIVLGREMEYMISGISGIILSVLYIISDLSNSGMLKSILFPVFIITAITFTISTGYVFLKALIKK
jgi:hypothetical protein